VNSHTQEKNLNDCGMYYKRPYFELIFLLKSEHTKLHIRAGSIWNEDRKHKMSIRMKGNKRAKGSTHTEEWKNKMSLRVKGKKYRLGKKHTNETLAKMRGPREPKSEFGRKFREHYGYGTSTRSKIYLKEYNFYGKHKICSWEV